jgi:dienelactone hydrolase
MGPILGAARAGGKPGGGFVPDGARTACAAATLVGVRAVLLAGALLLAASPLAAAGGFPRFPSGACARDDFTVSGSTVRAELCRTPEPGGRAVVVLHGCGGFSTFDHRIVTELPRYGVSTLDVDYFGLTPPPGDKGFCQGGGGGLFGNPFPVWVRIADDAAATLRATRGVNPRGVGVVGWSLGGGVALAAAAAPQRPFDALAGFSTGSFLDATSVADLPPTILLSGGRTDAIPLAETLPLYHALKADRVPASLYVYPHGSHNWPGEQGTLGIRHAAAFLRRYLR